MAKRLHNRQVFLKRRKDLRNNATAQEVLLWQHLKNKSLGYKFRRQHSVGPYILDFYCPQKHLAIEIDGSGHNSKEAQVYDQERTRFLESLDIKVVRFRNEEVIGQIEKVLKIIMAQNKVVLACQD